MCGLVAAIAVSAYPLSRMSAQSCRHVGRVGGAAITTPHAMRSGAGPSTNPPGQHCDETDETSHETSWGPSSQHQGLTRASTTPGARLQRTPVRTYQSPSAVPVHERRTGTYAPIAERRTGTHVPIAERDSPHRDVEVAPLRARPWVISASSRPHLASSRPISTSSRPHLGLISASPRPHLASSRPLRSSLAPPRSRP